MKKILSCIVSLAIVISLLQGCSSSNENIRNNSAITNSILGTEQTNSYKIAIIDFNDSLKTKQGQEIVTAGNLFSGEKGIGCTTYKTTQEDFTTTIELAQKSGAELVVMLGDEMEELFELAQNKYKNINFLLVNSNNATSTRKNGTTQTFVSEQSGWLAGYTAVKNGVYRIATLKSETIQEELALAGFLLGAQAAAKELDLPKGSIVVYPFDKEEMLNKELATPILQEMATKEVEAIYFPTELEQEGTQKIEEIVENQNINLIMTDYSGESGKLLFSINKNTQLVVQNIFTLWENNELQNEKQIQSGILENAYKIQMGSILQQENVELKYKNTQKAFKTEQKNLQEKLTYFYEKNKQVPTIQELGLEWVVFYQENVVTPVPNRINDKKQTSSIVSAAENAQLDEGKSIVSDVGEENIAEEILPESENIEGTTSESNLPTEE